MKKHLFGYILVGFILLTISSFGQQKKYPIKKVNGIEYYQYTVQVSEGLFAIGRKFEVLPDDISKANPEIKNGLKVGQQILIPIHKQALKNDVSQIKSKLEFIEHKVEKKQTLFAISHKYDVSQEDIKKYNPSVENGLREGIVLRIPKQVIETKKKEVEKVIPVKNEKSEKLDKNTAKQENVVKKNTLIHVVQADETLYSISRRYKVEVTEIIELNPASATKLAIGTELKIPAKEDNMTAAPPKKDIVVNTSKQDYDTNKLFDVSVLTKSHDKNKIIHIAFLLPFMLDQDKKDASIDRFIDFYAGSLLAIQDAKKKGISLEIRSFDTENSEEKLLEVLSNSELKTMDLIIGPAFTNQVSLVGDFAKENRINTLIPFTSKVSDIDSNPYLFQFNPGTDTELNFVTELLTGKYKKMHIVFAEIPGVSSMDEGKIWAEGLQKELKKANKSYSTLELTTSDLADFESVLKTDEKNLVIFNTDKYASVSPFIASLCSVPDNYNLVLFEQYGWRNQSNKMPKGMYVSPFKSNLSSAKYNEYSKDFTSYFGKSSSKGLFRYDLLGYDLSSYFISLIFQHGNKFIDKIGSYHFTNGIQSQPHFERTSNGSGFVNQQLYLYED